MRTRGRAGAVTTIVVGLLLSACTGSGPGDATTVTGLPTSPPPQTSAPVSTSPAADRSASAPSSGPTEAPASTSVAATIAPPSAGGSDRPESGGAGSGGPGPERPTPTRTRPGVPSASAAAAEVEKALEEALATAVEASLEVLLADAGITLSSGPQCDADLSLDTGGRSASGAVDCTGTTSAGLTLTAVFTGTVSAAGTCEGEIVVRVGGRTVLEQPIDECSVDVSLP